MTDENGIENGIENENSGVRTDMTGRDVEGRFMTGHCGIPGCGRPPKSRKIARDMMNGAIDRDRFKMLIDAKMRIAAAGTGRKSLDAAVWVLRLATELDGYNCGKRRRKKG